MSTAEASPATTTAGTDLRAAGERIEALLEASSAHGAIARERSEELVRLVVDLYGAGLGRLLDILYETDHLGPHVLDALAADDLVASLLLVHGLHPYDVETRVGRALDEVRPYLGSHGGDVEFVGITDEGVVQLRMLGSCDNCSSSSVTLELAVKTAIDAAAPEVTAIEVAVGKPKSHDGPLIPVSALWKKVDSAPGVSGAGWHPMPALETLAAGEVLGYRIEQTAIIAGRVGTDLYAYLDGCAQCGGSLADTVLERRLGGGIGEAVLRCPECRIHYDIRRAGAALDFDGHLEPLPLLVRDGVISIAMPALLRGALSA